MSRSMVEIDNISIPVQINLNNQHEKAIVISQFLYFILAMSGV